jgi:hypothetical protein
MSVDVAERREPALNLFVQEPSANIAITHDDDWITMLEKVCYGPHPMESPHRCVSQNLLQPEDLVQEDRLETLVSQEYNIVSEKGGYLYCHPIATDTPAV